MNSENQSNQEEDYLKNNTISLKKAKEQTKRWRDFLKKKSADYPMKAINKGAFIPFEDIEKLKQMHDGDKEIIGVRAYFALDKFEEKDKKDGPLHHVKLILVPVEKGGKNGKDIIETPSADGLDKTASAIYDFTMPCPDCCDETSALF